MATLKKILSLVQLKKKLSLLRKQGKKIAFTNGCFDILHYGHVDYLQKAKNKDRILVIGLNSDASIKRIKGRSRPIVSQKARAHVLAALESVDFVTIFNQDTPIELIKAISPDILIKGADWRGKRIAGDTLVRRVEFVRFLKGFSTTKIVEKIASSCKKR